MSSHSDYIIGDLKWSVQVSDHEFWLKCDGRSISRTRYAALFNLIGTSYGSDDSETFRLPDCRGRVVGCVGSGPGLTARSAGTSVGTETHTLTEAEIPSHSHGITDPGHTHTYINNTNDQNTDNAFATEIAADQVDLNKTTGSSTTGITVQESGGDQAHNIMQPTIFIGNVFIAHKTLVKY